MPSPLVNKLQLAFKLLQWPVLLRMCRNSTEPDRAEGIQQKRGQSMGMQFSKGGIGFEPYASRSQALAPAIGIRSTGRGQVNMD